MNKIEPDYNYQIITSGRSIGKVFFQNRIKQAYKSGLDNGFIEKRKLIKYLEDKIKQCEERVEYIKTRKVLNSTPERYINEGCVWTYKDILERLKSGKYD